MTNELKVINEQVVLGKEFKIYGDVDVKNVIYRISFDNNKNYIGQTTRTLGERIKDHIKNAKYNLKNYPIYNAINKYNNFNIYIEHICDSIEELNYMETYYIEYYNSIDNGYNCDSGGRNKKLSELTKKKISKSLKGRKRTKEQRMNISISKQGHTPWNKGKRGVQSWTEKQYKIMSERFSGGNNPNFNKRMSKETKKKISDSKKGKIPWNKSTPLDYVYKSCTIGQFKRVLEGTSFDIDDFQMKLEEKGKNNKYSFILRKQTHKEIEDGKAIS